MVEVLFVLVAIILLSLAGWYIYNRRHPANNATSNVSSNASVATFSGLITNINNGCDSDGACSITVDGKIVITGGGLAATQVENTYGNLGLNGGNSHFKIGQKVSVKALNTNYGYTLQTCSDCYVK